MLEVKFTLDDVARTRFAISPLWEVVAGVRVLKGAPDQTLHRRWLERVRPRLAASRLDLSPLTELIPVEGSIPGFLCPPPTTPQPSLDVELAALRSTPAEWIRTPGVELARLADTVAAYWELAMAPYWPRIRTLLEGDVLHRARRLAEGGAQRLFDDLDPQIAWDSGTLQLASRCARGARRLDGRGLLLVPSAFVSPRVFSVTGEVWQPTVRYPPRGLATLWTPRRTSAPEGLAAVLGRTRARLLAELVEPATTTDLAGRLSLTAGGVSQHLTALRRAGLVTPHRTGRVVLYARTSAAETLLRAAGP
ncbi:hypothetical protein SRB5_64560 [Streptomyces sp. RB5]|uniref:HTH arsR-type domain-containing protein n=1 Tax=Streptomyces smaragdinus TaxID=2585196 RepID=A0A7K0CS56_9ACTN|nr:DUF5937 family protein [Streptomyces smaragdinus]MQY16258.1 hypothetical protein [Streptomyces smaragdinus]